MSKMFFLALAPIALFAGVAPAQAEGFRAELHGGWDHPRGGGESDNGLLYGVGVGYDLPIGSAMFAGVEANLEDSTARDCVGAGGVRSCLSAGRDISLGGRIGWNVSEKGKLYALAGYTNARFKSSVTSASGAKSSESDNLDGFRLGAGYEHQISGGLYGKAEYRYSNYEAGLSRHQILFGVGTRF